jgi:hypothetical protein
MRRPLNHRAFVARAVVALASLLGCSRDPLGSAANFERLHGVVSTGLRAGEQLIGAPDTVTAGVPFTVVVTSFGSSSCTRPDGATLSVDGAVANITVWDRVQVSGGCTDDLRAFPRDVTVQFSGAGTARIRVTGRPLALPPAGADSLIVLERSVLVR